MSHDTQATIPFLDGKLLIAMPGMGDPRFDKAVVFMCAHSPEGAMGLIINKPAHALKFDDLMTQLGIDWDGDLPSPPVHHGGPVEHGRGFVLHSRDYDSEGSSMKIGDDFGMTASLDILTDIALGKGPKRALLALGYTGWAPGQLEAELQANGWLIADVNTELVFATKDEDKWQMAIEGIGIDPRMLSTEGGRA